MKRTPLHDRHVALGAKMVEFGGWDMPLQYPAGIVEEHLATRRGAGLFDVSHMGRFSVTGPGALEFLQAALSNDAAALAPGRAHYTLLPDEQGGAVDDAYLYCLGPREYLLVVNASNRDKDWRHLQSLLAGRSGVQLRDRSEELAMLSLQGPRSAELLGEALPESWRQRDPGRNALSPARLLGVEITLARTGYAGETLGCELFLPAASAASVWQALLERGAAPVGLGARDTLRLEAGLPLYGHELGLDPEGRPIPIFACPAARPAVSLGPARGDFPGREALARQQEAWRRIRAGNRGGGEGAALPRLIRPLQLTDAGVARQGTPVYRPGADSPVGVVTSGTVAPYWVFEGDGPAAVISEERGRRAVALAALDHEVPENAALEVEVRGRRLGAVAARRLLAADAPPYVRAVMPRAG